MCVLFRCSFPNLLFQCLEKDLRVMVWRYHQSRLDKCGLGMPGLTSLCNGPNQLVLNPKTTGLTQVLAFTFIVLGCTLPGSFVVGVHLDPSPRNLLE